MPQDIGGSPRGKSLAFFFFFFHSSNIVGGHVCRRGLPILAGISTHIYPPPIPAGTVTNITTGTGVATDAATANMGADGTVDSIILIWLVLYLTWIL